MKKTAYFLRSAPYNYIVPGKNLYQSFDLVARKKYDPHLIERAGDFFKQNVPKEVFHTQESFTSSDKRCIQTADFLEVSYETSPLLSEVRYIMGNLIKESEFFEQNGKPNVNKARKVFVNNLIGNKLEESYASVISRIDKLMTIIKQNELTCITMFSHGFYLKIIEAYIKNPSIKDDPCKLLQYFNGSNETFRFCEGFKVEINNDNVKFIRYIRNKKGIIVI